LHTYTFFGLCIDIDLCIYIYIYVCVCVCIYISYFEAWLKKGARKDEGGEKNKIDLFLLYTRKKLARQNNTSQQMPKKQ